MWFLYGPVLTDIQTDTLITVFLSLTGGRVIKDYSISLQAT